MTGVVIGGSTHASLDKKTNQTFEYGKLYVGKTDHLYGAIVSFGVRPQIYRCPPNLMKDLKPGDNIEFSVREPSDYDIAQKKPYMIDSIIVL